MGCRVTAKTSAPADCLAPRPSGAQEPGDSLLSQQVRADRVSEMVPWSPLSQHAGRWGQCPGAEGSFTGTLSCEGSLSPFPTKHLPSHLSLSLRPCFRLKVLIADSPALTLCLGLSQLLNLSQGLSLSLPMHFDTLNLGSGLCLSSSSLLCCCFSLSKSLSIVDASLSLPPIFCVFVCPFLSLCPPLSLSPRLCTISLPLSLSPCLYQYLSESLTQHVSLWVSDSGESNVSSTASPSLACSTPVEEAGDPWASFQGLLHLGGGTDRQDRDQALALSGPEQGGTAGVCGGVSVPKMFVHLWVCVRVCLCGVV